MSGPSKASRIESSVRHGVLIVLALVFTTPFLWLLSTSLKTNEQIVQSSPDWIPRPATLQNFLNAFHTVPLLEYGKNTLIVTLFSVLGALCSNTLVAYGFSRIQWRSREFFFIITLATLMLPFQVTMVPLFIMFSKLHWTNTFLPLIVPCFFGNAFYIFLLRQFFLGIPRELSEAARIEGASELKILWHIILPLARPALFTVALFQFLFSWNDFIGPLIYLNDQSKFTLALGLANMQSAIGLSDFGMIMAAAVVTVLPVILLFVFTQRYFIEGIVQAKVSS
ncbi:MAG TPA: carbohydrate ABC transporter permease [Chthoniobacterales bacterium]|nr:carbohydrate ABC transporter permease [Chthoniobacterales bacterium]